MKHLAIAGALALTLFAGGCADLTKARDFVVDPKTQQASDILISTAKAGAQILSCFVGAGTSIALAVEKQAGSQGQYATGIIYAASTAVCGALGGTAAGTVKATGGEAVVTGTQ